MEELAAEKYQTKGQYCPSTVLGCPELRESRGSVNCCHDGMFLSRSKIILNADSKSCVSSKVMYT